MCPPVLICSTHSQSSLSCHMQCVPAPQRLAVHVTCRVGKEHALSMAYGLDLALQTAQESVWGAGMQPVPGALVLSSGLVNAECAEVLHRESVPAQPVDQPSNPAEPDEFEASAVGDQGSCPQHRSTGDLYGKGKIYRVSYVCFLCPVRFVSAWVPCTMVKVHSGKEDGA